MMDQRNPGRGLVVSAHSADFVWRAGGAIALYASRGWQITIACLSFGERGESQKLWKDPAMTIEKVKLARREEASRAAEILGCADIRFFDLGDYPLRTTVTDLGRLADIYQEIQPLWVLTHAQEDPYNFDHPEASRFAQEARVVAQAHGRRGAEAALGAPPVFLFEPHQPEQCNWKPQLILNITDVWELKRRAFESMAAQEHLWEYYTRVALQRGTQGARNSAGSSTGQMKYGEAYQRVFPTVAGEFV
jgi:4-oxalomesaconate hydratase